MACIKLLVVMSVPPVALVISLRLFSMLVETILYERSWDMIPMVLRMKME